MESMSNINAAVWGTVRWVHGLRREDEMKNVWNVVQPIEGSVTSMYDCTHGPKKDCHACLIPEMAAVIEGALKLRIESPVAMRQWISKARAVLEKANLIEDCIPVEEAEEASRT